MSDERNEKSSAIHMEVSEDDENVAYVRLTGHFEVPREVSKCVRLSDLIGKYEGPDIIFDFDKDGVLLGLEILA